MSFCFLAKIKAYYKMYQYLQYFEAHKTKKGSLYILINMVSVAPSQVHGNTIAPVKKNRLI